MSRFDISGVSHRREGDADIISWSNREISKDPLLTAALFAGCALFGSLAIFLTVRLAIDLTRIGTIMALSGAEIAISGFFVLATWAVALFFGSNLIRLTWRETIRISADAVSLHFDGLFSPRAKTIPERNIWRLSFERYGHERHQESRFTLNLFHDDKRDILAYWMRRKEHRELFQLLSAVFDERGWMVDVKAEEIAER